MQKDFESWLQVMLKQQTTGGVTAQASNTTSNNIMSQSTNNFGATDAKVNENLQAFYKARDAIYKDLQ